jgi:hypothetical protein
MIRKTLGELRHERISKQQQQKPAAMGIHFIYLLHDCVSISVQALPSASSYPVLRMESRPMNKGRRPAAPHGMDQQPGKGEAHTRVARPERRFFP